MSAEDNQPPRRETHFYDVLGAPVRITYRELLQVLPHRQTVLFLVVALALYITTDRDVFYHLTGLAGHQDHDLIPLTTLIPAGLWLVEAAVYLGVYLACLNLAERAGFTTIYLPVVSLVATSTASLLRMLIGLLVLPGPLHDFAFRLLVTELWLYISTQAVELLYFRFILPVCKAHLNIAAAQPRTARVVVGRQSFAAEEIAYMRSEDHYVEIQAQGASHFVRARLTDLIAMTGEVGGFQPHRSWWVSRNAVADMVRKNKRYILRLKSGEEVPIARGKTQEARNWLDRP
ncbi:LytTR family DNA-binding domain-containing protein [Rhodophyticola sp.]|jgi:hypothetical protein|uniref:LytTR family DNA-binding domain-containing protein n=1 Tax=Rhodophyticola sp. TaxID=2680032 RepID=UPI003D2861F8